MMAFARVAEAVKRVQPEGDLMHDIQVSIESHIGTCEFCGYEGMVQTSGMVRKDDPSLKMSCTKCADCGRFLVGVFDGHGGRR
jgi:hypothetical protein